jgi:hypothetical protein
VKQFPGADTALYEPSGSYLNAPPRGVIHTTEGSGLPRYSGSQPHFTIDAKAGKVWQHQDVHLAAKALENRPGGVETNRLNCVQIEVIQFARNGSNWTDAEYQNLGRLMRWIEGERGIPRRSGVSFESRWHGMSPTAWLSFSGWCGHQHVPENAHWDPGPINIGRLLGVAVNLQEWQGRYLSQGMRDPQVTLAKRWLNKLPGAKSPGPRLTVNDRFGPAMLIRVKRFQKSHGLAADGIIGPTTWAAIKAAAKEAS